MPKIDLEVIFQVTKRTPSLPQATLRALQIIDDPNYSVIELARVIGMDQTLAARALQWANSPFYGLRYKVSTLEHAIMVMGTRAMQGLLLAIAVREKLSQKMPGYGLGKGDLWRHSVAVAAGSRWLAKSQKCPNPDQVFVAGLLHDIGKLMLDELLRHEPNWQIEWTRLQEQGTSFVELEHWLTGMDHAQLGGQIAKSWNLPGVLIEAITYHHHPDQATIEPCVTHWVHLADAAALMIGVGLGYDGLFYELSDQVLNSPGFRSMDLETLMEVEAAAVIDAENLLQIN
ncbi:MAG: HDOD domain-containing protein [Chloroflexota bacterium]